MIFFLFTFLATVLKYRTSVLSILYQFHTLKFNEESSIFGLIPNFFPSFFHAILYAEILRLSVVAQICSRPR